METRTCIHESIGANGRVLELVRHGESINATFGEVAAMTAFGLSDHVNISLHEPEHYDSSASIELRPLALRALAAFMSAEADRIERETCRG